MTLDPNTVALLGGLLITIGTWAYHKVKGDKQASIADTARSLANQALHVAVVTLDANLPDLRSKVADFVWQELGRHNIARNAISEGIVNLVIEQALDAALEAARDHDRVVKAQIAANVAAAQTIIAQDNAKYGDPDAWLASMKAQDDKADEALAKLAAQSADAAK